MVLKKALDHIFLPGSYWHGFRTVEGGGFYFFGADAAHDGFLTKTNNDLEIIWQHTFQSPGSRFPREIVPLEGDALLVVGVTTPDSVVTFDFEQDVQIWVAKMGSTSAIADVADKLVFQLFPNPLPDGKPLHIQLENGFYGTVKFELVSLDGRVLRTFFREKRAFSVVEIFEPGLVGGAFFVRVSDGIGSASQLVLKF